MVRIPIVAKRDDQAVLNNVIAKCCAYSNNGINNNNNKNGSNFWSKHRLHDDVSFHHLQKFWSELSRQARQDLLRIDKQMLFEQARKNMYCSRCNGLLLDGFNQIVTYGKSLQQEGASGQLINGRVVISKEQVNGGVSKASVRQDETRDPSVHPWGGLTTTRDGALTLLDCYLFAKSLKALQNVFDSARARERERELLYPDACGGGGRGWISQGIASYGRGHGTRETCALHTARLSCDTLVDFWSALGEETRLSLLRMKEEDFMERLMYRFDSKRFCRDCRRNVIREFKELKELKRMRKEPQCTSWFCVADTAFQYEVSDDAIHVDWHQTFIDSIGSYHHFEWAVGSGEGKADILDFENVGMNGSVQVNGLDLGGLNACYITLRAWKLDGRCTEFSVKAHALKGRPCVHCRLVVGDGYVSIARGESIRRFFEHAEEAEEEEDDESMDKDGNDMDGECSRPQKHAKSPELAREFLLDAATVIFKEQVEKAFREGTARQNAHSIFVCLGLKLLEERIHVACKEIITLEKQTKLLEEEEKEKREEEERKERKRLKEREKKLRRKERLRGKDKRSSESSQSHDVLEISSTCIDEEGCNSARDSQSENGETNISESASPGMLDESSCNDYATVDFLNDGFDGADGEFDGVNEDDHSFTLDSANGLHEKVKLQGDSQWSERRRSIDNGAVAYKSESRYYDDCSENLGNGVNSFSRQSRTSAVMFNARNGQRFSQKVYTSNSRMNDCSDSQSCGCNEESDYRTKVDPHLSSTRFGRDNRSVTRSESSSDKPANRTNKFSPADYMRDNGGRPRSKVSNYGNALGRDSPHTKKVWEPVESQKRYPRSNSDSDFTLRSCSLKAEGNDSDKSMVEVCPTEISVKSPGVSQGGNNTKETSVERSCDDFHAVGAIYHPKDVADESDIGIARSCNLNGGSDFSACSSSSSDNCSSCLSEGDSNTLSPNHPNIGSSSTSDSEDSIQQSEGGESTLCGQNDTSVGHNVGKEGNQVADREEAACLRQSSEFPLQSAPNYVPGSSPSNASPQTAGVSSVQQGVPSHPNPNISFPVFQGPSAVGYYHQNPVAWSTAPGNGLMAYAHPNHYFVPGPFGYGVHGESPFCMQYGPVQHLASPFMNSNQIPVYQPVSRANCLNPLEQAKANGIRDAPVDSMRENVIPAVQPLMEAAKVEVKEKGKCNKVDTRSTGFSLFQFGGPVALQSSEERKAGDMSVCHVDDEPAFNKKENTIEEYNLFAASNGIQFSIF